MDEAEHLADRIAVIAGGRIVAEGTPGTLGGRDSMASTIASHSRTRPSPTISRPSCRALVANEDGRVTLHHADAARPTSAPSPSGRSRAASTCPTSTCGGPTLEDVYLAADRGAATMTTPAARGPLALVFAPGALRPPQLPPQPTSPLLHARPAAAVPGHLQRRLRQRHVVGPGPMKASAYYVPGIAALGVIAASFVNLVISITAQREGGILKRRRATPVPARVLVAGRTAHRGGSLARRRGRVACCRPRRLRRQAADLGPPGHRLHCGRRLDHVLRSRLRALDRDSERGRGPAGGAGDHAAALLHLRHLHPEHHPSAVAPACCVGVSRATPRCRFPPQLRARRSRRRDRLERHRRARDLGGDRCRRRAATVQLAAEGGERAQTPSPSTPAWTSGTYI